jgi:hypothetical protein
MSFHPSARVATSKGPNGEVVVTKTYTNYRYTVTMGPDGAIKVKHGDWLSKYSAAMYNDFKHIDEFGRRDQSGKLRRIQNVNRIVAGETIFHIPTYRKAHPLTIDAIEISGSPLSEHEKREAVIEMLKADYGLQGERLIILEHAAHLVHGGETMVELAEIAGLIGEGAVVVTVVQGIAAALTPIAVGIAVLNANETDTKLAGMQAIGYALTAWAFNDPIPRYPSSLKGNVSAFPGKQALPKLEAAWNEAAAATVRNLEAEVVKKRVHKKSYQTYWQALGEGDRKKLARLLMEARTEELPSHGVERMSFWGLDPDRYPN